MEVTRRLWTQGANQGHRKTDNLPEYSRILFWNVLENRDLFRMFSKTQTVEECLGKERFSQNILRQTCSECVKMWKLENF